MNKALQKNLTLLQTRNQKNNKTNQDTAEISSRLLSKTVESTKEADRILTNLEDRKTLTNQREAAEITRILKENGENQDYSFTHFLSSSGPASTLGCLASISAQVALPEVRSDRVPMASAVETLICFMVSISRIVTVLSSIVWKSTVKA